MADVLGAVLKKDRVRMTHAHAPCGPATTSQAGPGTRATHTPLARIVRESHSEVLIEVACSCGRRTLVRCQYPAVPDGAAEGGSQTPLQGEDTCVV
jgi:hypothetical protein